jgi:polyvinyl alcohol dehydrogenase (cytochrome)
VSDNFPEDVDMTRTAVAALLILLSSVAHAQDWPMYGNGLRHSFTQPGSAIRSGTVSNLKVAWTFVPGDAVTASPTVVEGVVYVGSWDGYFYALNAATGAVQWKFQTDCDPAINPLPAYCPAQANPPPRYISDGGQITASAAVRGSLVYFAAGKTVYCLNRGDGSLKWKKVLCGNPDSSNCEADPNDPTRIFSSPAIFDNKVYVGHSVDGAVGYRGGIKALDAGDGHLVWAFETDPIVDASGAIVRGPNGRPVGGQLRGCGNTFSSAAIDSALGTVVYGMSDCQSDASPPYGEAVLSLDAYTGALLWSFRPRATDSCDFDFGASANILELGGKHCVGIGGKDGTYYLLRNDTSNPGGEVLWKTNVVFGGSSGGFIGSTAYDGTRIYGATGYGEIGGPLCDPSNPRDQQIEDPSFHALDAATGQIDWEVGFAYSFAAATVTNDVVIDGWAGLGPQAPPPSLRIYAAANGALLYELPVGGSVSSAAAIVGSRIFFGSGNSYDGSGAAVWALKL